MHWTAFSSQKEWVWQLTQFPVARKERPGLNRISHPDWVKLSAELNLRAKPKYEILNNKRRILTYLFGFHGISTFVGYFMPNPFYKTKQFYFKQFNLV